MHDSSCVNEHGHGGLHETDSCDDSHEFSSSDHAHEDKAAALEHETQIRKRKKLVQLFKKSLDNETAHFITQTQAADQKVKYLKNLKHSLKKP